MDKAEIVKGLRCCIEAETTACPEDCPLKDEAWRESGRCACKAFEDGFIKVPTTLIETAIAVLDNPDPRLEELAEDYGLTPAGLRFALEQYPIVVSEITHGLMSKLTYAAHDILQVAQDRWCDTCELKQEQEPVEPKKLMAKVKNGYRWRFYCGKCGDEIDRLDKYCRHCGRTVKW